MKSSTKVLVLALILALITAFAFTDYLRKLERKASQASQQITVVTTVKEIPSHTKITADMVKTEQLAAADVPQGVYHTTAQVVGLYTSKTLVPHEMIFSTMILQKGEPGSFAMTVPAGLRAMSIQYTEVKVAGGHVSPGDKVDVLATFTKDQTPSKQDEAKIVLQDVLVLAMGAQESQGGSVTPGGSTGKSDSPGDNTAPAGNSAGKATVTNTVTLGVTPEQAELLGYSETFGQTRLLLRQTSDNAVTPTAGAVITSVLNGK